MQLIQILEVGQIGGAQGLHEGEAEEKGLSRRPEHFVGRRAIC